MSEERKESSGVFEKIIPFLLMFLVLVAFVVGILWQKVTSLEKNDSKTADTTTQGTPTDVQPKKATLDQIKDVFSKAAIKFGDSDKKVLIVEVADPSCPYCHVAGGKNPELNRQVDTQTNQFVLVSDGGKYVAPVPEIKKLVDQGKVAYAYIYSLGHGNGEMGMKALYCAFDQNKYWEAHDLLYTSAGYKILNEVVKNDKTQSQKMADFLKSKLDSAKLKECLDSGKYDSRINSDMELAKSIGVTGTPSFFINDVNFPGAYGWTDMEETVNQALK